MLTGPRKIYKHYAEIPLWNAPRTTWAEFDLASIFAGVPAVFLNHSIRQRFCHVLEPPKGNTFRSIWYGMKPASPMNNVLTCRQCKTSLHLRASPPRALFGLPKTRLAPGNAAAPLLALVSTIQLRIAYPSSSALARLQPRVPYEMGWICLRIRGTIHVVSNCPAVGR